MRTIDRLMERYIKQELNEWIKRIRRNMDVENVNASKKAYKSLKVEVEGNVYKIIGVDYFEQIEKGYDGINPPAPSNFERVIFNWTKKKGIYFKSYNIRKKVARNFANSILEKGTRLYQEGGRTNIYSDVFDENIDKLKKGVTEKFKEFIYGGKSII